MRMQAGDKAPYFDFEEKKKKGEERIRNSIGWNPPKRRARGTTSPSGFSVAREGNKFTT